MKSKKMAIILSTTLILSTSSMPVFARSASYNQRHSYGYGQSYNGYENNNGYGRNNYGSTNDITNDISNIVSNDTSDDITNNSNLGTYINNIQTNLSQTNINDDLKSEIKAKYAEISTIEKSNSKISKQINSKEAKIRNFVKKVKSGKITYTSEQIAELTTLSSTLQTDMQAITTDSKTVKIDEAAVKHIGRSKNNQTALAELATEETDIQTLGTALTKVNSDLDSIIIVLQGQSVTTSTAVQSVSAINAITVANGTTVANLGLPTTIGVTLSDGTAKTANVTWDTSSYVATTAGNYILTGTVTPATGDTYTVPAGITASVTVTVNAPTTVTLGTGSLGTAGNDEITGLAALTAYNVSVGGAAATSMTTDSTGAIIGLDNTKTYVVAAMPSSIQSLTVTLSEAEVTVSPVAGGTMKYILASSDEISAIVSGTKVTDAAVTNLGTVLDNGTGLNVSANNGKYVVAIEVDVNGYVVADGVSLAISQ